MALKLTLNRPSATQGSLEERFLRHVKMDRERGVPGSERIIQLFGSFEIAILDETYQCLVEECLGHTLSECCFTEHRPPPAPMLMGIIRDVLCGVAYMHSVGYAHGDLDEANLLVSGCGALHAGGTGEPHASIIDFGSSFDTVLGQGVKTHLRTRPPEAGDKDRASRKSDVWAAGKIWGLLIFRFDVVAILGGYFGPEDRAAEELQEYCSSTRSSRQAELMRRFTALDEGCEASSIMGQWFEGDESKASAASTLLAEMLDPDPEGRPTAQEALSRLDSLTDRDTSMQQRHAVAIASASGPDHPSSPRVSPLEEHCLSSYRSNNSPRELLELCITATASARQSNLSIETGGRYVGGLDGSLEGQTDSSLGGQSGSGLE